MNRAGAAIATVAVAAVAAAVVAAATTTATTAAARIRLPDRRRGSGAPLVRPSASSSLPSIPLIVISGGGSAVVSTARRHRRRPLHSRHPRPLRATHHPCVSAIVVLAASSETRDAHGGPRCGRSRLADAAGAAGDAEHRRRGGSRPPSADRRPSLLRRCMGGAQIARTLTDLYNAVAGQVAKVSTLSELAGQHAELLAAWRSFVRGGADTSRPSA